MDPWGLLGPTPVKTEMPSGLVRIACEGFPCLEQSAACVWRRDTGVCGAVRGTFVNGYAAVRIPRDPTEARLLSESLAEPSQPQIRTYTMSRRDNRQGADRTCHNWRVCAIVNGSRTR